MQCEDCGDAISLSNARRRDGQFVCPACHANDRQRQSQAREQQQTPSRQRGSSGRQQGTRQQQEPTDGNTQRKRQPEARRGIGSPTERLQNTPSPKSAEVQQNTQPARTDEGQRRSRVADSPPAEKKFNTLRRFGKIVSFSGWVFALLGGIGSLMGMAAIAAIEESMMIAVAGAVLLPGGVLTLAQGLLLVVLGQQATCFVAIERNTRSTYELMQAQQE